jgi:hypothetical protein
LAFLSAAHRLFVAATIRARPSGLRRRFFLAAFADAGVAAGAALAFRTGRPAFPRRAAMRRRAAALRARLGVSVAATGADGMCADHAVPDALQRTEDDDFPGVIRARLPEHASQIAV